MTPRFRIQGSLWLMLLAYALAIHAQEQAIDETAAPALLELLEFIGEFTTEDGEWVDPAVLLEADDGELGGGTQREPSVLGGAGGAAGEVQPAVPVENCIAARCE